MSIPRLIDSTSERIEAPVVVKPDTVSKNASIYEEISPLITKGIAPKIDITIQESPTTLNRVQKEDGSYSSTGYTENDYDHFSLTKELQNKLSANADRVDAVNIYYSGDNKFEMYRKQVSDHVPIKLDINLRR